MDDLCGTLSPPMIPINDPCKIVHQPMARFVDHRIELASNIRRRTRPDSEFQPSLEKDEVQHCFILTSQLAA